MLSQIIQKSFRLFRKIICTMNKKNLELVRLSPFDGKDFYDMLKHIGSQENDFTNPVHDMSYREFKLWLKQQDDWSRGENLPHGYVPQVCFWLVADEKPVGLGKIRMSLTEESRLEGGNIGYAIDSRERGKGFGSQLLRLLLIKAKEYNLNNPLITVRKNNAASKRVAELNGARLVNETEEWLYFEVNY